MIFFSLFQFTYWFDDLQSMDENLLYKPLLSIPSSGIIPGGPKSRFFHCNVKFHTCIQMPSIWGFDDKIVLRRWCHSRCWQRWYMLGNSMTTMRWVESGYSIRHRIIGIVLLKTLLHRHHVPKWYIVIAQLHYRVIKFNNSLKPHCIWYMRCIR